MTEFELSAEITMRHDAMLTTRSPHTAWTAPTAHAARIARIARTAPGARAAGAARRVAVSAVAALLATACANVPSTVTPDCARPAPLLGQYDGRAPGYQVRLREPSEAAAREVVRRHALKPRDVSSSGEWIALEGVSSSRIAQLRCDAAVESIQFDAWLGRLVR